MIGYLYVFLYWVLPFLVAAGLGLLLPLLLAVTYRSFTAGLVIACLTCLLDAAAMSQPLLRIGLTLYPGDLPMVLLGAAGLLRWLLRDDVPRRPLAWGVLALVFLAGLGLGLARHGTGAGVQARVDFYAIAMATYAMSFPIGTREVARLLRALCATALALLLLSAYRWTVYYGDIRELLPPGGTYNVDGAARVVASNFALLIAEAALVGMFFGTARLGGPAARLLAPLMFAGAVVLQHRSVWLAALAGGALSLLVARSQRAPLWQQLAVLLLVAGLALVPLVASRSISSQLESSASHALAGQGTVQARFENWRVTIEKWAGEGPRAIAFGRLPGSDTVRTVRSESGELTRIAFGVHNHYVGMLTGMGVVGLLAFLAVFAGTSRGLWRLAQRGDADAPASAVLLVLLACQAVYYVAYGVDFMQYLVLGTAVAWVGARRKAMGGSDVLRARARAAPGGRPAVAPDGGLS